MSLGIALVVSILPVASSDVFAAIEISQQSCRTKIVEEMSTVHDEYRAHLFGSRSDMGGAFSVLTGGKSEAAHVGILETKGRLTSELIAPLVESYRVYRCHASAVCAAAGRSFGSTDPTVTVKTLGCASETLPTYPQCNFQKNGSAADTTAITGECQRLVVQSLAAERAVLHLAVAYDTGYRAALQLGGMIDLMQQDLPSSVLKPIRDMVSLLGKLHIIPCFIGQCDNPNTNGITN